MRAAIRLSVAAVAATFAFAVPASAQVVGSLGGGIGTFLGLSGPASCTVGTPCTLGPGVATIVGGQTLVSDQPFADIPKGGVFGGRFLAAGPTSTQPATLTFTSPVNYISFLWGSPDMYNNLTVNTTTGPAQLFTASSLGFAVTNGNQAFSQYVQFQATPGSSITSLVFNNSPAVDAFEVANFSVTSVVPEPSTYALMAAGLAGLFFAGRRRRVV